MGVKLGRATAPEQQIRGDRLARVLVSTRNLPEQDAGAAGRRQSWRGASSQ